MANHTPLRDRLRRNETNDIAMVADRRIETIRDVPEKELDAVLRDFKDSGATEVLKTQQPDGKWTLEARFEAGARYPASGEFAA